jgi:hypothetical protein
LFNATEDLEFHAAFCESTSSSASPANAPELSRGAECELLNQTAWGRRRLQLLVRWRRHRLGGASHIHLGGIRGHQEQERPEILRLFWRQVREVWSREQNGSGTHERGLRPQGCKAGILCSSPRANDAKQRVRRRRRVAKTVRLH